MKMRPGIVLLLAGVVSGFVGPIESARAQDPIADAACQAAWDTAVDTTIKAILQARGVPEWAINIGDGTYQASKEYLSNPDGERLNKAALSATKSALSAMVPGAGAAIAGGELSLAGVEATIGEAEALRAKAFLCEGFSYGALRAPGFFSHQRVQQIAPGVTCENFADRVTTYRQLSQMKEFWEGFYSRQVKEVNFDDQQTRDMLGQAWFTLQQQWAARWAETEYRKIREEMLRSYLKAQQCAPTTETQAEVEEIPEDKVRQPPSKKTDGGSPAGCRLAGVWTHDTKDVGSTVWTIDESGKATESGIGNATGTATLSGHTLTITWKTRDNFAGSYQWDLNESCTSGSGQLTFTAGRPGSFKSTVSRR